MNMFEGNSGGHLVPPHLQSSGQCQHRLWKPPRTESPHPSRATHVSVYTLILKQLFICPAWISVFEIFPLHSCPLCTPKSGSLFYSVFLPVEDWNRFLVWGIFMDTKGSELALLRKKSRLRDILTGIFFLSGSLLEFYLFIYLFLQPHSS